MGKFNRGVKTNLFYMVSDFLCGILATLLTGLITGFDIFGTCRYYWIMCIIFTILCIFLNKGTKLYNNTLFFYPDRIIRYITKTYLYATGVVSTLLFYLGRSKIDRKFYIIFLVCLYVLLLLSAFSEHQIMKRRKILATRTLLLGDIDRYSKFVNYLYKCNIDIKIIGYVSLYGEEEGYLGKLEDLEQIIHDNAIDKIYIMDRKSVKLDIQPYINMCMDMGVTVGIIMGSYREVDAHSYISSIGTYPVLTYHTVVLNNISRLLKRSIDIIGSIVGIILSLPIMLIAAIAIKIEDPCGPVIFKQKRVGQNGRQFYIYKFRSMCADAEQKKSELLDLNEMDNEFMFKIKDDPRITRVGKLLRKTNIDELPQFFNVFLGDMSLVGTRPPTLDEVENYDRPHWRRVSIKPGITGLWQVSGRSQITDFNEVVELDTEYIDRWSILLDIKILLKTVIQMFFKNDGAY